jgi:hypothetical protein
LSFSPAAPPRHGASCCSASKLVMTRHLLLAGLQTSGAKARIGHDGAVNGDKPPNPVPPCIDRALVLDGASLGLAQSIRSGTIMSFIEF